MINQIRATYASAVQQWHQLTFGSSNLTFHAATIPMAAVLAWIAMQRGDASVLSYLLIGLPLMTIWGGVAFRIGYTLTTEIGNQILQFVYISRTPVIFVALGKALAQVIWGLPTGLVSFGVVYLVTRTPLHVEHVGPLIVSLILVIVGMAIASLFFSPLMVLVGGRGGFFNTVIPFGLVLSGFVFPVDRLPIVLQVLARLVPTSWAMDAVWLSIKGTESAGPLLSAWGMCILTSFTLSGITYLMFRGVEKKLRMTGTRDYY